MNCNFVVGFLGFVFGIGFIVLQMVNLVKVFVFFDIFGDWDFSLLFVMGGVLLVIVGGYCLVWM